MPVKKNATRVLIVDDHPILRQGISQLINQEKDLEVCGEAGDVQKALDLIEKTKCEIAILDISLNGASGIELLKDIKVRFPKLHVLILSMHDESIYAHHVARSSGPQSPRSIN